MFSSIQTCISPAVAALIQRQPFSQAKMAFAWRAAVGDAVSRASTIALANDGTLAVRAADQHWRREIQRSSPMIIARLRTLLGDARVERIVVDAPVEKRAPRRRAPGARRRGLVGKKR